MLMTTVCTRAAAGPHSAFVCSGNRHPFLGETKPEARVLGLASGAGAGFQLLLLQGLTCKTTCSARSALGAHGELPETGRISESPAKEGFGE